MKKIILAIFAIGALAFGLASCKKSEPEAPKVTLKAPVITAKANEGIVNVSWVSVTNATGYVVEYKLSTQTEFVVAGKPSNSPFSVKDLEFGNTYNFRVKATCGEVESEYSNVVSCTLERFLPKPTLSVNAGISFIDVTWEAVEGAASYIVEHKTSIEKEFTTDYTGDGKDVNYLYKIQGLTGGVSYDVRILAIAPGYNDTASNLATVTTTASPSTMIATAAQFKDWLAAQTETTTDVAALANDIDMSGVTITSGKGFAGTLEGQGFAIKNLKSNVPFFAKSSGTFSNLVIDSSCEFTPSSNVFGIFSGYDQNAVYANVTNKAKVIFKANADVTDAVALGAFAGVANSDSFSNCINSGEVKFDATGYVHNCALVGGFIGGTFGNNMFENCKNDAPVSLLAAAGNPMKPMAPAFDFTKEQMNKGLVCVAGFVGRDFATEFSESEADSKEKDLRLVSCENTANGVITLNHSDISKAENPNSNSHICIAGFLGMGNAYIYKCTNNGDVNAVAKSGTGSAVSNKALIYRTGGLLGHIWDYGYVGSSRNNANVSLENDCSGDNSNVKGGAGGIVCTGGYNGVATSGLAEVFYCTMAGNVTISGLGKNFNAAGIMAHNGKQIGNKVLASCTITSTVSGGSVYVGGLCGILCGNSSYTTIKSSSCAATIIAETTGGDDVRVGGLLGQWGGANGDTLQERDGTPCSFSGSILSKTLTKHVGVIVGQVKGSGKTIKFGDSSNPIQACGEFEKAGVQKITLNAETLETYKYGSMEDKATFNVTYVAPTAE